MEGPESSVPGPSSGEPANTESDPSDAGCAHAPPDLPALLCRHAPGALLVVDGAGRIRHLNDEAAALFGYTPGELLGEPVARLVPEADGRWERAAHRLREPDPAPRRTTVRSLARSVVRGDARLRLEGLRRDGTTFPLEVLLRPLEGDGDRAGEGEGEREHRRGGSGNGGPGRDRSVGRPGVGSGGRPGGRPGHRHVVASLFDLSDLGAFERRLRESEARYRELFEGSNDAIVLHDLEGRVLDVNRRAVELWGHDHDTFPKLTLEELTPPGQGHVPERLARIRTRKGLVFEEVFLRADGSRFHGQVSARIVETEAGPVVQGAVRDVTRQKRLERELAHRALHHPLTGLPNRRHFEEALERALERALDRAGRDPGDRSKTTPRAEAKAPPEAADRPAVLFLDLDNLKEVNDGLGHVAGDAVLRQVAGRLRSCLRAEDLVAHVGGDEFTVLVARAGEEGAYRAARRVREALELPVTVGGTEAVVTASVGVAVAEEGDTVSDLLRFADAAMFEAKKKGPGRIHLFDRHHDRARTERLARTARLRRALEREEFRLEFQPLVELETGRIRGAEALVRWEDPERGTVPPLEFIPLAEETGLIRPLAWWIVEEACRTAGEWVGRGLASRDFTLAVNLSAGEFHAPELPDRLARALQAAGLEPHRLLLEITEGVLVRAPPHLAPLRRLGIRLALDDFGTGYSSLEYLKRLPVDVLKIDRTFVAGLPDEDTDRALVGSILALASFFGLEVVAEGIETEGQLQTLRRMGCTLGQGYRLARPLAPEAFGELLEGGRGLLPEA